MSLPRSGLSLLAALLLSMALAAVPTAAAPHAAKLRNCPLTLKEMQRLGGTYTTSLKVHAVSCARGKAVVRAFHKCRESHGGLKGRCPRSQSVLGYHCREIRVPNAAQFTSKVTCAFGSRRVVHTYTQNT